MMPFNEYKIAIFDRLFGSEDHTTATNIKNKETIMYAGSNEPILVLTKGDIERRHEKLSKHLFGIASLILDFSYRIKYNHVMINDITAEDLEWLQQKAEEAKNIALGIEHDND